MPSLLLRLCVAVVALWWASLVLLGTWIVPALFRSLPTKAMAGQMAASLFSTQAWVAMICGLLLLILGRAHRSPLCARWCQAQQLLVLGAVLAALLVEFAVAPHIVARENLALWHSFGSGLLLLQLVLVSLLMWRLPIQMDQAAQTDSSDT